MQQQLITSEPQQHLTLMLKAKPSCLANEILSKISTLPNSDQAELLGLAAPKLQDEKLKEAFNMVLLLENKLSKGLCLIEFLPYLQQKDLDLDLGDATVVILSSIENLIEKEDKTLLIESFIKQLQWLKQQKQDKYGVLSYLIKVSQDLALIIQNNFELNEQISLEGKSFKLMCWSDLYKDYSLYPEEKKRLIERVEAINSSTEKYLLLLSLLKDFPLEQEEINELSCLALNTLEQSSTTDTINLKDKISLLAFLPEAQNKSFGTWLYQSISNTKQEHIDLLENLNSFATKRVFNLLKIVI
jgi:hypothetical protein